MRRLDSHDLVEEDRHRFPHDSLDWDHLDSHFVHLRAKVVVDSAEVVVLDLACDVAVGQQKDSSLLVGLHWGSHHH